MQLRAVVGDGGGEGARRDGRRKKWCGREEEHIVRKRDG